MCFDSDCCINTLGCKNHVHVFCLFVNDKWNDQNILSSCLINCQQKQRKFNQNILYMYSFYLCFIHFSLSGWLKRSFVDIHILYLLKSNMQQIYICSQMDLDLFVKQHFTCKSVIDKKCHDCMIQKWHQLIHMLASHDINKLINPKKLRFVSFVTILLRN